MVHRQSGDGIFSALDVLTGINTINSQVDSSPQPEGETSSQGTMGARRLWPELASPRVGQSGMPSANEMPVTEVLLADTATESSWAPDPYFAAIGEDDSLNDDRKKRLHEVTRIDEQSDGALEAVLDGLSNLRIPG